jgi:hypothetical protein
MSVRSQRQFSVYLKIEFDQDENANLIANPAMHLVALYGVAVAPECSRQPPAMRS